MFLELMLPTSQFKFSSAETVCEASFSITHLDRVSWLGGKGYNCMAFYVHGVEYQMKDGTSLVGTYLPVLFENLADSIVSGREELGMPAVFCDIDMHMEPKSCRATAAWKGAQFAEFA